MYGSNATKHILYDGCINPTSSNQLPSFVIGRFSCHPARLLACENLLMIQFLKCDFLSIVCGFQTRLKNVLGKNVMIKIRSVKAIF